MPLSVGKLCRNLNRHSAYPLPQIELVRALIEQHSAALPRPRRAPCARIVVCLRSVPIRDKPARAAYLPVAPAAHKLFHFPVNMVGALVEHHSEYHSGSRRRFVHLSHLLRVNSRRLFHHNMDMSLKALFCVPGVVVMRHSHKRRVYQSGI